MTCVKDLDTGEQSGLEQIKFFAAGGLNYKGIARGNTITGTVMTTKGELPWTATRK